eukprot:TRINITY_DN5402_c0_g3_i1.p1 TRINITY_DN5402_c0_g3~~TRINITY_DN5402_c0_g3_i1.p1  ORF type:complete len:104 (+),score=18.51 TRINITY_DN5402_c0_g3_i1:112-423(+)
MHGVESISCVQDVIILETSSLTILEAVGDQREVDGPSSGSTRTGGLQQSRWIRELQMLQLWSELPGSSSVRPQTTHPESSWKSSIALSAAVFLSLASMISSTI